MHTDTDLGNVPDPQKVLCETSQLSDPSFFTLTSHPPQFVASPPVRYIKKVSWGG